MLLDAGEDFESVAKRLGHANTAMLHKRYGHKFKKGDKSAVSKRKRQKNRHLVNGLLAKTFTDDIQNILVLFINEFKEILI